MKTWHLGMCADNLPVSTLSEISDIVTKLPKTKQLKYMLQGIKTRSYKYLFEKPDYINVAQWHHSFEKKNIYSNQKRRRVTKYNNIPLSTLISCFHLMNTLTFPLEKIEKFFSLILMKNKAIMRNYPVVIDCKIW